MEQTQVNNNDAERDLPSKSNEESVNRKKSKVWIVVLRIMPILLFLLIVLSLWMYQSDTIKMDIPGKITLEFTYPLRLSFNEKRESTLHFNLLDKTLNPEPTVILRSEERSHIIQISEEDGKLSDKITLDTSKLGMVINLRITKKQESRGCKFQLVVKTGSMSEAQYSEVHSIIVIPWKLKELSSIVTGVLALVAVIQQILTSLPTGKKEKSD